MSEIRVDRFKAEDGISAPQFPNGIQVTGVVTATVLDTSVPILAVGANIDAGAAGIVTAKGADVNGNADISGDLNVDGHTNLDNVNIVGVLTATGAINASHSNFGNLQTTGINIENTNATINFVDTNNNPDYRVAADSGVFDIDQYNNGGSDINVVKINTDGHIDIATNVDFNSGIDVTGNATVSGNLSVGGVLTYEDVTNIDSVGIITARAGINNTGGNITLGDSSGTNDDRIKLGDGGDLQIFHSGSHSFIADFSGTGQIQILTDAFRLNNAANNENMIAADQDGSVSLYENNSLKFKTGVTGDYGSVQLQNGKNSWYGVSCNGQTVFMSDGNDIGLYNDVDNEWILKGTRNGEVQLRYNGSIKFQTLSTGAKVTGVIETNNTPNADPYAGFHAKSSGSGNHCGFFADAATGANAQSHIRFGYSGSPKWQWRVPWHSEGTSAGMWLYDYSIGDDVIKISQGGNQSIRGHVSPRSNNTYDLGTSSTRWRNIYTMDLQLSNKGSKNDVDGTWGDFTIQEGESDLFLINKRNGKKYKFNLTEVS